MNIPEKSITANMWWVIPNQLGGVRKPTEAEITVLQAIAIGGIVSVMDDSSNLDLYERLGINYLWLPVKGGTAPSADQIEKLSEFVQQQNSLKKAVLVHCTSGRKRTGTFLAAYLISRGQTYQNALETVLSANPDVELREAQTDFLQEFFKNRN